MIFSKRNIAEEQKNHSIAEREKNEGGNKICFLPYVTVPTHLTIHVSKTRPKNYFPKSKSNPNKKKNKAIITNLNLLQFQQPKPIFYVGLKPRILVYYIPPCINEPRIFYCTLLEAICSVGNAMRTLHDLRPNEESIETF